MEPEIEPHEEEQELYEHYRINVDKGQGTMRIDKFLSGKFSYISRNRIQAAADANSVLVNNKAVKSSYKIKPNDVISIVLPNPPKEFKLIPENIPLNIVYEDDDLIVVNKQAGLIVHPGLGHQSGTLVNALLYHFENLPSKGRDDIRPGLVHRIDLNTSGIIVIGKSELAMTSLAKQFFDRTTKRTYLALVWGDFKENSGTITGNIGRSLQDRKIFRVFPEGDYGKHAVTHYKVLERFGYVTLVECKLETARTHQIRVHFKHIGHPIFNDDTYGGDKILRGTTFTKYKQFVENCFETVPRHCLHAKSLGFVHPTTKKEMLFDSELPTDMKEAIEKWRGYAVHRLGKEE